MKVGKNENVKIVGCGTGQSSNDKKTPYFTVEFENQDGDSIEAILYLTDLTKERNLQKLVDLGFLGKRLADLSDPKKTIKDLFGPTADAINITVKEEQVMKDGELQFKDEAQTIPKMRQVVEWINIGEGGGISKFDHAAAVKTFSSLTFDSEIQALRKKTTTKAPAPAKEKVIPAGESAAESADGASIDPDDCPF